MNNLAKNVVNLLSHEVISQLEAKEDVGYDLIDKQIEIRETIQKALDVANSSPNGEVTIHVCKSHWKEGESLKDLRLRTNVKIGFFNTNLTSGYMSKTLIFISPRWTGNFRVFRGSMSDYEDQLKEL